MKFDNEKVENSMKKYNKLDCILQKIFNERSKLYFAFGSSEKEVINKLKKQGCIIEDLMSVGCGGYIHKKDVKEFNNLNKYILDVKKQFCKDYYNVCGLYLGRLWDYEARISWGDGYDEALKDVEFYMGCKCENFDKELLKLLYCTEKYYNKEFDKCNGY